MCVPVSEHVRVSDGESPRRQLYMFTFPHSCFMSFLQKFSYLGWFYFLLVTNSQVCVPVSEHVRVSDGESPQRQLYMFTFPHSCFMSFLQKFSSCL